MLSLITRVQYQDLYHRMIASALGMCAGEQIEFVSAPNPEGQPVIAPTYNRLAERAKGEVLVFLHDDIEFVEEGWDSRLVEFFAEGWDIAGVVGVDKYEGGLLVSAGRPHCFGKFVNRSGNELKVNLYGPKTNRPLVAVDGMFMACTADFFKGHKFDPALDGLFFYDIDWCLGKNVGLVDTLLAHHKPPERYGKYPEGMRQMEDYEPYFYGKHGINPSGKTGDTRAVCASREDYERYGHDALYQLFEDKYPCLS